MGVILTGMGPDGSAALRMPGAAVKLGGAGQVLPLNSIAKAILAAAVKA